MINFNKIIDWIFVGTCPATPIDVQRLQQGGITAVLNLQSDADLHSHRIHWPELEHTYHSMGIAAYRVPIIDFDDEDMTRLLPGAVSTLNQITQDHERVYVHCTAGQQRSPSAVIGYLAWYRDCELEHAIKTVMDARRCAPPLHVIRALHESRQSTPQNSS